MTAPDPAAPSGDEPWWPDFLALPEDTEPDAEQAAGLSSVPEPDHSHELDHDSSHELDHTAVLELSEPVGTPIGEPADDPGSEPAEGLASAPAGAGQLLDPDELAESAISPVALRMLGASPSGQPGEDDLPPLRHQVVLGDDQIDVVLAEPTADGSFGDRDENSWLASAPHLAWTPLPYDIPEDGLAFACVGAGDEGCLFIDLAAAPGAVAITGDNDAAVRLAESIAHQLCANAMPDRPISVLIVDRTIPEPHPATAISVQSLRDLTAALPDHRPDGTDIVFCELHSTEDAFALARIVGTAQHRIVPIVLGNLPGAAWSFTAYPSPVLDDGLLPLDSDFR